MITDREQRTWTRQLQDKVLSGNATNKEFAHLKCAMGRPFKEWCRKNGVEPRNSEARIMGVGKVET